MIRIVTDSTCDLDESTVKDLRIELIPMTVHFGEESYLDGVTLSKETFYEKLTSAQKLPTTSQLNPMDILDRVKPFLEQGDDVVAIFLSSELSGTFQSAVIAAGMADSDHFFLVDSENVTFGMGLLLRIACALRDKGRTAEEICEEINSLKKRVRLIAVVDTLKYLQMGGRISATTAVLGNLLGINPLVGVIEGKVQAIGKVRGKKAAYRHLLTLCQQELPDPSYPLYFGHSRSPETMEELREFITSHINCSSEIYSTEIGSVVGTHVGPGAAGLAYIAL